MKKKKISFNHRPVEKAALLYRPVVSLKVIY